MRAAITNLIGNAKLKFIDVWNTILAEEVRTKDSGKASTSNSMLNVDYRRISFERNSNKGMGIEASQRIEGENRGTVEV